MPATPSVCDTRLGSQSNRGLDRPLEQPRVTYSLDPGREGARGASPTQLVHVLEEGCVSLQGRELLEQQGPLPVGSQHSGREPLDRAVLAEEPGRRGRTNPVNSRIAVLRIADQREEVGNERRLDADSAIRPPPRWRCRGSSR